MAEFRPTWLEEPLPPSAFTPRIAKLRAAKLLPTPPVNRAEETGFSTSSRLISGLHSDDAARAIRDGPAYLRRPVARKDCALRFTVSGTTLEVLVAAHLGICSPAV